MPTSTEARADRRTMIRNGFTLVELMVVMTLVALSAGAVVVTIGSRGGPAQDVAAQFAGRLGAARDEAVIRGSPVGAWVSASGFGFERFANGDWSEATDKPLAGSNWPEGVSVAISGSSSLPARIRFDALGLPAKPLTVQVVDREGAMEVRVDANGDVVVR